MVSRAMEHIRKLKSEDPSHPLVKRKQTDYPAEKKVKKFKDPLTR